MDVLPGLEGCKRMIFNLVIEILIVDRENCHSMLTGTFIVEFQSRNRDSYS